MAALVEGQQYGLSAQDKINCNKSLVFVKLTDSALRSIEEYVKYKGNNLSKPTIEFQNNNGVITLPMNGCSQTYGFTLSNVEADGPKGSFECLRQNGPRPLESLGCMHMKMHIHAKEDSYEKTRVKMAAAEQEHKKFCTKEIKPNGPHLGRKVKVKRPGLVVSPVKISSPPTSSLSSKTAFKPLNAPPVKKPQEQPKFPKVNTTKNKFANSSELLRQPIRDRIIHILAIRPYKRPELLVRLMSEGVREKDRNGITAILTQVGTLKGNVYSLANYLWNEVQENWKYCTQEELEIIRKRKQQYFISNNENEIPNPNTQPNCSPVQKRVAPEPVTTGQEPRSKKQRISHYNRPDQGCKDNADQVMKNDSSEHSASDKIQPPTVANFWKSPQSRVQVNGNRSGQDESCQKSPVGIRNEFDSYSNSSQKNTTASGGEDLSSSLNQRSSTREDSEKIIRNHTSGLSQVSASYTNHDKSSHKGTVISKNSRLETDDTSRQYPSNKHQKTSYSDSIVDKSQTQLLSHPLSVDSVCDIKPQVSPDSNTHCQSKESRRDDCSKTVTNGYVNNSIKNGYNNQPSFLNRSKVTSTTNGSCSNSPHSSSDSRDSMEYNSSDLVTRIDDSPSDFDCPEYRKEYGMIVSSEQRAQYKADFSAEYEEYLRLHSKINLISRKFASLEHHLNTCKEGSEEFKRIKGKIYKEYRAYHQDSNYLNTVKKFNFLHCKLSHIKRLVMEYDSAQHVKS